MTDIILVEGDHAAGFNRLSASTDDSRVISYRLAHFMRFRDGKVVENISLIDSVDAAEQVLGHPLPVHEAPSLDEDDLVAV